MILGSESPAWAWVLEFLIFGAVVVTVAALGTILFRRRRRRERDQICEILEVTRSLPGTVADLADRLADTDKKGPAPA